MNFHAEFFPKAFDQKINHRQKLLLIGSCFTEEIGNKLIRHKFMVLQNPSGILFNPASIAATLSACARNEPVREESLFYHNELWNSWKHHSRFSGPDRSAAVARINESQSMAHTFLQEVDWVMITLGSAYVYETSVDSGEALPLSRVVANCHKVPLDKFNRRLLEVEEVIHSLTAAMQAVQSLSRQAKFIFTISPVRHLREGFIENNRSKSRLIQAVHAMTNDKDIYYFPAYELVIDDLRDYRFYADDMVHPNYAATNYVWEKFITACIDEQSQKIIKDISVINAARHHKPFNPGSSQHKKFLQDNLEKVRQLKMQFSWMDLSEETKYFSV